MNATPESLYQQALHLVEECRGQLTHSMPDLTPIDLKVRIYCEAVAALPREEGRKHIKNLHGLMAAVDQLKSELIAARDATQEDLNELSRHKQANSAYQKSDNIAGKKPKVES